MDGVQHEAYPEVVAHDHHELDGTLTPEMEWLTIFSQSSLLTRCSRNSVRPKVISVASLSDSPATSLLYLTTSMTVCSRPCRRPAGSCADHSYSWSISLAMISTAS